MRVHGVAFDLGRQNTRGARLTEVWIPTFVGFLLIAYLQHERGRGAN
jgi:hypothetical protein